ncbi:MAG TPA: DoxX family protein [Longimicrobiales bacterium]|nr:DoxX family protein [Longimicrobiales bacterium]
MTDIALLLLRLMIALLFGSSGWAHATSPDERAESIGMSPTFTLALGVAELTGAASVLLGVVPEAGAAVLMAVMLGAIYKKAFVWETGFWGEDGQGWYYDALYLVCNLVILATGGGTLVLI